MEQQSRVTRTKWNVDIQGSVSLKFPNSVAWTALGSLPEIQKERPEIIRPNIQHWLSTSSRFPPSILTPSVGAGWAEGGQGPEWPQCWARGSERGEWVKGKMNTDFTQGLILLFLQCVLPLLHCSAPLVERGMSVRPGCSWGCKHMDLHLLSGELGSRQPHWM